MPKIWDNTISWERLENKYVSNKQLREEMENIMKEHNTLGKKIA